jgi:SAM-dependent methyltransferase
MLQKISTNSHSYANNISKKISRKGIYSFLENEFDQIQAKEKVLNIGAGGDIGLLLKKYAHKNDFQIVSFDIDERTKPDIVGDICTHNFNCKDFFDFIVVCEVLEHVSAPHLAIEQIYTLLKQNGKLILTVPFIFPIHCRPYDYYRFTKYGLKILLKNFKNLNIVERNSWADAIHVLIIRLVKEKKKSTKIIAPFLIIFSYLFIPLNLLLSKLISSDFITTGYLVTAKK